MDDDALDELEGQLAALRMQALEQIALSQKIRLELERSAAGNVPVRGGTPSPAKPQRPSRERASRTPVPASVDASSWRTLGARLRHRMRLV
ncbi:hypothetical protein OVY01_21730 [Robbsia sp. Bb-Pol-6]|uniref:Uncharacterized protein n=1 Tax=Robbsia betulipollinis TaxID=2981849 RepID=A0ABT3ZT87_9BURK|nr:hypothetical protein [Robbsia betulipollinis]MCY0389766.1 hypothetical protein [Robbsia betulipollinis]